MRIVDGFTVDEWTTWVRDRSRSADGECGAICSSILCTLLARSFYCCSALHWRSKSNKIEQNRTKWNEMKWPLECQHGLSTGIVVPMDTSLWLGSQTVCLCAWRTSSAHAHTKQGQVRSHHARSSQIKQGKVKSSQARQVKSGKSSKVKSSQARQVKARQGKSSQARQGHATSSHATSCFFGNTTPCIHSLILIHSHSLSLVRSLSCPHFASPRSFAETAQHNTTCDTDEQDGTLEQCWS